MLCSFPVEHSVYALLVEELQAGELMILNLSSLGCLYSKFNCLSGACTDKEAKVSTLSPGSLNHIEVWVGRDLRDHLFATPVPWAGTKLMTFCVNVGEFTYLHPYKHHLSVKCGKQLLFFSERYPERTVDKLTFVSGNTEHDLNSQ